MNALIITTSDKTFLAVTQVIKLCGNYGIVRTGGLTQARELAGRRRFDIAVICPETRDAGYREVAETLSASGCGTVFIPPSGIDDSIASLYDCGVQLVNKPITRGTLYGAIRSAAGFTRRLAELTRENARLKDKLETERRVSKAKCLLIERGMTEDEAHKEIERSAMEQRRTRLETASGIIEKMERTNNG